MPVAALRDPANETPPADRLGLGVTGLGDVNDFRAILIDGVPVGG